MDEHLLEVKNLKVSFKVGKKKLTAVDNVTFSLDRGKVIGIVGESGCGKSVTATSIMRLVSPSVCEIDENSQILFEGEDLSKASEVRMRKVRGNEISMIFQEPMSSLNPVYRIGDQMLEMIRTHHREIPKKEAENMKLAEFIKEYDERFNHILGYRRMTSWINHFNHTDYKPKRVHRIMKKLGIHSVIRKKKKKYTSSAPESIAENKLGRDFYACAPNEKWATDVTEFKVPDESKKLYLSVILDLYDRYPVAYVISPRNDNKLVFKTFDKALATNPEAKPLFHSDRGFQYTSKVFQKKLKEHEMEQSMSRVGRCIDNGPTEGFWGIIKTEMYQMYEITNEESLRFAITDYIRFYSEERPQDRYHCKTPLEVRMEALSSEHPAEYLIPRNKRIEKYKKRWCA